MSREASEILWFEDSPDDGDPGCLCSYCKQQIESRQDLELEEWDEGDPDRVGGIRMWKSGPKGKAQFEARFHDRCFREVLERGLIELKP